MRLFRTTKNCDDIVDHNSKDDDGKLSTDSALPTLRGWTHLLKKDPAVAKGIANRAKTPVPQHHRRVMRRTLGLVPPTKPTLVE